MAVSKVGLGWPVGERNYDSLNAWLTAKTASTEFEEAICNGSCTTAILTISAAGSVLVGGALIRGHIPYDGTNEDALAFANHRISLNRSNIVVEDLLVNQNNNFQSSLRVAEGSTVRRLRVIHAGAHGANYAPLDLGTGAVGGTAENCVISTIGTWGVLAGSTTTFTLRNSIVFGSTQIGLQRAGAGQTIENVFVFGPSVNYPVGSTAVNSASEDLTGNLTGFTSAELVNFAGKDYRVKADSPLKAANIGAFFDGAAADVPVSFTGTVPAQNLTEGEPFSLDLSTYFSGNLTPFTYSVQAGATALTAAGISLDTTTGVLSGAETLVSATINAVIRVTDTENNTADTNSFSITVAAVINPPDVAPANLTATVISSVAIGLEWDPVAGATGYKLQVDAGPLTDVGNVLAVGLTDLTPDTTYAFRVLAYNSGGDGQPSAAVSATTEEAPPGTALTLVTEFDSANASATLSTITNPTAQSPEVFIDVRPATLPPSSFDGWKIMVFGVDGAEGKTPLFRLNRSTFANKSTAPTSEFRPMWTQDFVTFTRAPSVTLTGGIDGTIDFQFTNPLPAGKVYIMTHPMGQQVQSGEYAAALLTNYAGIIEPAPSANASGVYFVSPAETDENGRQIGGHNCYALKIDHGLTPSDGGIKRTLVMTAGIHAQGEQQSWTAFKACLDYILNSQNADAQRIRSNYRIYCYFNICPNGIFGGHRRHNFRNNIDLNRNFDTKTQAEVAALVAAITSDTAAHGVNCCYDWHGVTNSSSNFFMLTPESAIGLRFKQLGQPIFGVSANDSWSNTTGTYNQWALGELGATFSVACECQGRGNSSVETYKFIGESWAKLLSAADAEGIFFTPVENTLALNITGIPDGQYNVRLFDRVTGSLLDDVALTFTDGLSEYTTSLPAGTVVDGYVLANDNPPSAGAVIYGVIGNGN